MPDSGADSSRYSWKEIPGSSHEILRRWILSLPAGLSLLDLGAGQGHLGKQVRPHVARLTGVEVDPAAAAASAGTYDRWITSSLSPDLSFGERFDIVVCADILEHLAAPRDVLSAIRKWLNPGGLLFVSLPNIANVTVRLSLLFGRFEYAERGILDRGHMSFFTRQSARKMLTSEGFQVERVAASAMPAELAVPLLGRPPLSPIVRRGFRLAAGILPTLFGYQFVLQARAGD